MGVQKSWPINIHQLFFFPCGSERDSRLRTSFSKLLLIITLFLPNFCLAGEWDRLDKELFVIFSTFMAVDMFQTRFIFEHDEFHETNPIISKYFADDKVYAYFALTTLGAYLLGDNLRPKYRKPFLRFLCGLQVSITQTNANLGIGFTF